MNAKQKTIIKYILLPGIIPRARNLFSDGFFYIAFFAAAVFGSVRLLPEGHPYLNPANAGKYTIRNVIAAAADALTLSRRNIDQILVFCLIMGGMIMLVAQFILLILAFITEQPAVAQNIQDIFLVNSKYGHGGNGTNGAQDLAFNIMDRVFGVKGIYNSCISTGVDCLDMYNNPLPASGTFPTSMHKALHGLLQFYSYGIFLVAVFVLIYYTFTIIGETAATGTPFGRRLNKGWAPVRLILFFALLTPLNTDSGNNDRAIGLNGAQLITLWTAKLGSNFATNAWGMFNENITTTYLGEKEKLIAAPNVPEINDLLQFMFVVHTCNAAHTLVYGEERAANGPYGGIDAYLVRPPILAGNGTDTIAEATLKLKETNYDTALKHARNGNINIRFGLRDDSAEPAENFRKHWGNTIPYCGQIQIPVTHLDKPNGEKGGASSIQEAYYDFMKELWVDDGVSGVDTVTGLYMTDHANCLARNNSKESPDPSCIEEDFYLYKPFTEQMSKLYQDIITPKIRQQIQKEIEKGDFDVSDRLKQKGWAGAAIWYNRIAKMNGDVTGAIMNPPRITQFPIIMENVRSSKQRNEKNPNPQSIYDPTSLQKNQRINFADNYEADLQIAQTLSAAYNYWANDNALNSERNIPTDNIFINTINAIFGTYGLFSILENKDIHPLAQLSTLGKSIMDASIRNVGGGLVGTLANKIFPNSLPGEVITTLGTFFKTVGWATMVIGFLLYYVLPFMPFLYFFFSVGVWMKGIFEAIVAMPLWALSFLTIDGHGPMGTKAKNGVYLLLEIFLRPILMLFGLLASIQIFASLAHVLNEIFDIVIYNTAGYDLKSGESTAGGANSIADKMHNSVNQFFYTAIYTIFIYTIGQSCFKLIDSIPNTLLRWMGFTVQSFQDEDKNAAMQTSSMIFKGSQLLGGQLSGGKLGFLMGGR